MTAYLAALKRFEYGLLCRMYKYNRRKTIRLFAQIFTGLGGISAQVLIVLIFLVNPHTRAKGWILGFAHLFNSLLVQAIKFKTGRLRPYQVYDNITNNGPSLRDRSFPSGHTSSAFVTAVILSYFFPFLWAPLFILALCISLSRLALGVHYPSDVIIGALTGILVSRVFLALII